VQSALLDQLPTRWVVPLVIEQYNASGLPRRLCPEVFVNGAKLFAWPHQTAPLIARSLGKPVASLRAEAAHLIEALDAVTSGI
jgi:CcdB protein